MADIVPAVYMAGGAAVWIDFMLTNPDGLANVGLMFYVLPVTAAGLLLGKVLGADEFVLLPAGLGYLGSHAAYYFPSLLLLAWLLRKVLTPRSPAGKRGDTSGD